MVQVRHDTRRRVRRHRDTPDTDRDFRHLASLPPGAERDVLRDTLITRWLPVADRVASRFRNRGEDYDDLRQIAAMGLVKAVDRFDPELGTAFVSYAVPTVAGEIKRHFRDHVASLHMPRRVQELRLRVRRARQELTGAAGGGAPTVAQVAEHTGLSEEDVLLGLGALDCFNTLSLDADMADGYSLLDTLGERDERMERVVERESVKPLLHGLPDRERGILYLRFFCGMTQSQIGDRLGISQMHVSRLISRTCGRIRREALACPT